MSIFTSLFEFLFGLFERLLGPLLALLFLGGCTMLSENNTETEFLLTNGFVIRSNVAKVPDTVAKRQIIVDQALFDLLMRNSEPESRGSVADGG